MTNYYDISAVSASGINTYLNKSPLHFWNESTLNPNREQSEDTEAMLFGRLTHCLLLEPEVFEKDFFVLPKLDKRTKAGKEQYAILAAENEGKTEISADNYAKAIDMIKSVKENQSTGQLLRCGEAEKEFFWDHEYVTSIGEEKTLQCKCKADYYRQDGLIIDYKTIDLASIDNFQKSVTKLGYHRQAAWYMDGIKQATGVAPKGFVFILQDKKLYKAIGFVVIDSASSQIPPVKLVV